jgi:hypothetical protein
MGNASASNKRQPREDSYLLSPYDYRYITEPPNIEPTTQTARVIEDVLAQEADNEFIREMQDGIDVPMGNFTERGRDLILLARHLRFPWVARGPEEDSKIVEEMAVILARPCEEIDRELSLQGVHMHVYRGVSFETVLAVYGFSKQGFCAALTELCAREPTVRAVHMKKIGEMWPS